MLPLHGGSSGFWEEYWSILSDPAHLAAELTMTLLDLLILSPLFLLLWRVLKRSWERALRREHRRLDAEHGVNEHS